MLICHIYDCHHIVYIIKNMGNFFFKKNNDVCYDQKNTANSKTKQTLCTSASRGFIIHKGTLTKKLLSHLGKDNLIFCCTGS